MKFLIILATVLVLSTVNCGPVGDKDQKAPDLCDFQAKLFSAISAFSPSGQQAARTILLDVQHEVGKLLQNAYAQIKTQNKLTLDKLQQAEGNNFTVFLNAIGFYNSSAFSGDLVDLCQIQKDGLGTYNSFSNKTQAAIKAITKYYMDKAKPQFNSLSSTIMSRNQGLIMQLYKTEKMEKLMALANLLQSIMKTSDN